jgi:hypothetical protein
MFTDRRYCSASLGSSQLMGSLSRYLAIGSLAALTLSGCVVTGAAVHPSGTANVVATPAHVSNAAEVLISESDIKDRSYVAVGDISAWGRSVNLLSSNPTRADVDEALRVQAAKLGADAVILVRYRYTRTGLASRGKLTGEGRAVAYKG